MHDFKKFPELKKRQVQIYYFNSPIKQIFNNFFAKVIRVIDGDTIRVKSDDRDKSFPIRFIKNAAAEINERGGVRSKNWLEKQINNEIVEVVIDKNNRVGKWGRILGEIYFKGRSINDESISMGYSVVFGELQKGTIPDFQMEMEEREDGLRTRASPKLSI
jgi:endonuclease YncB( thermonuclease family)